MDIYELIAPCHFGLESVMKREILDLGYEISSVEDGKVTFLGDAEAIAYANIFLRTTERVLLKVGQFQGRALKSCLSKRAPCPGRIISPKTGNFGLRRLILLKASCSALQIFSLS